MSTMHRHHRNGVDTPDSMTSRNTLPAAATRSGNFLADPEATEAVEQMYARDLSTQGYVAHLTRLWATSPESLYLMSQALGLAADMGSLDMRERSLLITAAASAMGDSFCSLVWGSKLAGDTSGATAAAVIGGDASMLSPADAALVAWARRMALDPNSTKGADVEDLRRLGYGDRQIFAITLYVALRLAFATVNDTLGAAPDPELVGRAPGAVLGAIDFGRPPAQ